MKNEHLQDQEEKENQEDEDDDSEDEPERMVYNMIGQTWEKLRFFIIIDSGACASVMPIDWCSHTPVRPTSGSEAGEFFRAAKGKPI